MEPCNNSTHQEQEDNAVTFVPWPSINLFYFVPKQVATYIKKEEHDKNIIENFPLHKLDHLEYQGKVKLHGCNAAVNIQSGKLKAQSRNLFVERNSPRISKLVYENEKYFLSLQSPKWNQIVIFGEYCGPKIQKGVALCDLKEDIFVVFSIYLDSFLLIDPEEIKKFMTKNGKVFLPKNVFIIPWFTDTITLDLTNPENSQKELNQIDEAVQKIDAEDPWVKEVFGIVGHGEGLVMYPTGLTTQSSIAEFNVLNVNYLTDFSFKAKGTSHAPLSSQAKNKKSIHLEPEKAKSVEDYVNNMCSEARLQQGANEIGIDITKTKSFISWMMKDIHKEGQLELEVSNLSWKSVAPIISKTCSIWYLNKCKELVN